MASAQESADDITPTEFLKKIRDLSEQRDREDAERYAQLEQSIERDREARRARREERARSLSPEKSLTSTPTSIRKESTISPSPSTPPNPIRESTPESMTQISGGLSRTGTLSWQQRPKSISSKRPLSLLAAENNASRSPRNIEFSSKPEEPSTPEPTRAQIANSLASKDPTWFRQTADRGVGSAAYRRNQVEDTPESDTTAGKQQLPGMSHHTAKREVTSAMSPPTSAARSTPTVSASVQGSTAGWNNRNVLSSTSTPEPAKSPLDAPRLAPAMESPQVNRPASPTKGMGGFVQSAMMKRSDSVNKRWSQQGTTSLNRQSSNASNRSSYGQDTTSLGASSTLPRFDRPSQSPIRTASPTSRSRPLSSYDSSFDRTLEDVVENDGAVKPAATLHSRSKSMASIRSDKNETSQPPSPSKRWSPTKSSWLESALGGLEEKPKPSAAPAQPAWMVDLNKAKAQKKETETSEDGPKTPPMISQEITSASTTPFAAPVKSSPPEPAVKPNALTKERSAPAVLAPTKSTPPVISPKPFIKPAVTPLKPAGTGPQVDFRGNLIKRAPVPEADQNKEPEFLATFGKLRKAKTENFVAPDIFKGNIQAGKAALTVTGGPAKRERVDELKDSLVKQKEAIKVKAAVEGPRKSSREVMPQKPPEAVALRQQMTGGRNTFKDPLADRKIQTSDVPEALARQRTMKEKTKPEVAAKPTLPASASIKQAPPMSIQLPKTIIPAVVEQKPATPSSPEISQGPFPGAVSKPGTPAPATPSALRAGVSSNVAGRLNPALVGMLARGPSPMAGNRGGPSSEAAPSQFSIPSSTTRSEELTSQPGQDLTHMTKGRARGPKRKAPSSKSAQPAEAAPVKASGTSPVAKAPLAIISKPTVTTPSVEAKAEIVIANLPIVKTVDVISNAVTSERVEQTSAVSKPKPLAPNKSPSLTTRNFSPKISEQMNGKEIPEKSLKPFATRDTKASPTRILFPTTNPTTSATRREEPSEMTPPASAVSPGTKPNLWGKPTSYSGNNELKAKVPQLQPAPASDNATKRSGSPEREHDDLSNVSVKNAMSAWGRTAQKTSTQIRSPIKLPTQADEDDKMREAGLLKDGQTVGLGIAADQSRDTSRSTIPILPLSPPLSAGLPQMPADVNTAIATEPDQDALAGAQNPLHDLRVSKPSLAPSPLLTMKSPRVPSTSSRPVSLSLKTIPKGESPIPQTTEASQLFMDFFDERPIIDNNSGHDDLDVGAIIEAVPPKAEKVITVRKQVFELSSDGNPSPVPAHQEHILFDESAFVCIHTYSLPVGTKATEVFLWLGAGVATHSAETSLNFTRKIAREHNARVSVISQGKETPAFLQAIGGILVTFRGQRRSTTRSGLPKTFMLCARRHMGHIVIDEVDFELASFCSGFAYIVCSNSRLYVWKGTGCHAEELGCARLIAMDLGTQDITEIEEGSEPTALFRMFGSAGGSQIPASADYWKLKPRSDKYNCRLFRISTQSELEPSKRISNGTTTSAQLEETDVYKATANESPSRDGRQGSITSLFTAASNMAGGMVRKRSWGSLPINTSVSGSPTRTSRPQTPVSPATTSRLGGYFSAAASSTTASGLFGFKRRESSDNGVALNRPPSAHESNNTTYTPPTFTTSSGVQVTEIHPFTQVDLETPAIYLLDAYFSLHVIVHPSATSQAQAFCSALLFAQDYGILAASMEDRPQVPIGSVVFHGVPADAKTCFRGWSEEVEMRMKREAEARDGEGFVVGDLQAVLKRRSRGAGVGVRSVGLGAALAAVRP